MKTLLKFSGTTLLNSNDDQFHYYDLKHSLNVISFFWTLNEIKFPKL